MKNKATRNNMRGFSLMEMLVTVLILVILFALAMIPISKIQKNLRQTELDSRAEMIFSAVQNRMTRLQAAGQDSYYQPTGGVGAAELMNMIPKDAEKDKYKKTTLAYVTSADKNKTDSAASWIYPETEAEAELWDGSWVVEFDPSSGSVYAVFFSREDMDYTPKDFDDLRDRDNRLENGAKIGYYGGDSVGAAATESLDLRHDFVIRQLQTHDWPYVARVSGMAVSTLRDAFSPYLTKPAAPENPLAQRDEAEYLLWRVIQQEGSSPAGLALWMGWKLQMQPGEIASLTWGQVDFDQNLIRLPDRTVSMGSRLRRLLLDAWDRRKDPTEPRVFTAPTTGRPMDLSRLTTVTRTALIRGGLEHVNLRNLHTWVRQGDRAQLLMAQAEEQGWLTREAVMERLGVSKSTARQYLLELREAGRLVRVGTRYYPAGAVADPDDHLDIIRAYLQEHGTGRRQDFIRLLGLEPEQGTLLLRRLTDRGELVLTGRHYTLPEQEK